MNRTIVKHMFAVATTLVATAAWAQQPFDLDPSFRLNAESVWISSIFPLPDGDIIVSGLIAVPGEWPNERGGAKLHQDGSLDLNFPANALMGGKITPWQDRYYCGNGQGIRRLLMNGTLDPIYLPNSQVPYLSLLQGGDYHVFPDGRVLVSGHHLLQDSIRGYMGLYGLIWFTEQGDLDTTRVHRSSDGTIFHLFPLADGKFICSGFAWGFDGISLPSTAFRVLDDGALDTTFQAPPGYVNVKAIAALADGKLVIGGDPSYLDNGDTLNLMRLMPNGSMDPTFHTPVLRNYNPISGWLPGAIVTSITPLDDDKYIITGKFTEVDGQPRGGIALIDTAGNLIDDLFANDGCGGYQWDATTEYWGWMNSIAGITQAYDGSYYIYGAYHGYDDGTTNDPQQRLISRLHGLNVGISEVATANVQTLQIAPNPSSEATVLSVAGPMPIGPLTNAQLTIHDGSGRVVWQATWPAGAERYTLAAGTLAPGAYVVRVSRSAGSSASDPAGTPVYTGRLVVMP